jgi:hypothetical protein
LTCQKKAPVGKSSPVVAVQERPKREALDFVEALNQDSVPNNSCRRFIEQLHYTSPQPHTTRASHLIGEVRRRPSEQSSCFLPLIGVTTDYHHALRCFSPRGSHTGTIFPSVLGVNRQSTRPFFNRITRNFSQEISSSQRAGAWNPCAALWKQRGTAHARSLRCRKRGISVAQGMRTAVASPSH